MSYMQHCKLMMRAIRVATFGGPDVLKVETDVPVPKPGNDQVLIEVKAAGVNPIDTFIHEGNAFIKPKLPYTPGFDLAGIVKELGQNVTKFKEGERVYAAKAVTGAYAEFAIAEENMMGHLEDNLSFEQGAALGIPYYTAFRAMITQGKAEAGQSILIHGASGGVGLACVQIAKAKGLTVYGTAGTQEGIDLVLKNGATACFNHRVELYTKQLIEATKDTGIDIIIEMKASKNIDTDINIVNRKGTIMIVGSGGPFSIDKQAVKKKDCRVLDVSILRAPVTDYLMMHEEMTKGMKEEWLQPHIGKVYSLEEAGLAHREIMNSGISLGKRVIKL